MPNEDVLIFLESFKAMKEAAGDDLDGGLALYQLYLQQQQVDAMRRQQANMSMGEILEFITEEPPGDGAVIDSER